MRVMARGGLRCVAVVAATLLVTGCADGGGDDGPKADATDDAAGSCATDVTATFPDGSEVRLDRTAALDVGQGAAYTVYAADFDVSDANSVSGAVPTEDGHLATVAITTFNASGTPDPVEEGSTIEWTGDFGVQTFSVVLNQGITAAGNTAGAAGALEVVSLDDEALCVDVDYSDDEKSLTGTIAADLG